MSKFDILRKRKRGGLIFTIVILLVQVKRIAIL